MTIPFTIDLFQPGDTWYSDNGTPAMQHGQVGDNYFEVDTRRTWKKTAAGWEVVAEDPWIGPQGPPGPPGPQGPAGPPGDGGSGVTDHGALTGLADDDHPQYVTHTEADADYQPLNDALTNLAATGGQGMLAISDSTFTPRTMTGTLPITVQDGDGAGNPLFLFTIGTVTAEAPTVASQIVFLSSDNKQCTLGEVLALLNGYIAGLVLSNAADADHDITIATGAATDSAGARLLKLTSALTKQIDAAWAAGSAAGGLFTGTVANATWYHVFLIRKDSDGTLDAGFDTDVGAANIPTGYTAFRRIGSVLTNGSANIIAFQQIGDEFLWKDPPLDISVTAPGTSAVLRTLSVPPDVKVLAKFSWTVFSSTSNNRVYFSSPDVNDEAASFTAAPLGSGPNSTTTQDAANVSEIWTNTSKQVRSRVANADANTELRIATYGWRDQRGRNS